MKKILVTVYLKEEILDPSGRAVKNALTRYGISNVQDVRQGKQFAITLGDEITTLILTQIEDVAKNLLSNPVIEDFIIEVKNES